MDMKLLLGSLVIMVLSAAAPLSAGERPSVPAAPLILVGETSSGADLERAAEILARARGWIEACEPEAEPRFQRILFMLERVFEDNELADHLQLRFESAFKATRVTLSEGPASDCGNAQPREAMQDAMRLITAALNR